MAFLKEQQRLMGQHAPHRVLDVACSRRRSEQELSLIELLKGFPPVCTENLIRID
jgi:hypothetical protein